MKWLFGLFLVFLLGASSASPHTITIPCDEACQEELLKNESTPAFIVDGCLLVKDEEAGDFLVCDEEGDALIAVENMDYYWEMNTPQDGYDREGHVQ